jgi:signal transduction histidine kinase
MIRLARLPIRAWLALALLAIVLVPTLTGWGLYSALAARQQRQEQANIAQARRLIAGSTERWSDPAWQASARARLSDLNLGAQLICKPCSKFAPLLLGPKPANPVSFNPITAQQSPAKPPYPGGYYLYQLSQSQSQILADSLIGAAIALLLTLGAVTVFLGRTVVRPLAAMSRAARQITSGDLDVRLPSSRAREVAEVTAALQAMSGALQEAGQRQAGIEQERRLFIGAIAHDLRTPLFTLRAYLGGLEQGLATTPERTDRYISVCREKADALERLIADLFAFARVEYLEQAPRREAIDLGDLLRQAADEARPRAAAKGINLASADPGVPCPCAGDQHLLTRAIENLLDNAIRHTPAGGEIGLAWGWHAAGLRIAVEDSGTGIAAHDLPHIFTPLYRGEASRNRQTGGAGLGLTIAQRILKAHGGDLLAANKLGGGAIFTATLPVEHAPRHDHLPPTAIEDRIASTG